MSLLDRDLDGVWPRPSQCGAAAAVSVCLLSLAAAAAGAFIAVTHLIDHFLGGKP